MINIFRTSKVSVETSPVSLLHHKALLSFVIPQIHEVLLHAGMQTRDSGVLSTPGDTMPKMEPTVGVLRTPPGDTIPKMEPTVGAACAPCIMKPQLA